MELIDLKEKEVFQKQGRGMANLVLHFIVTVAFHLKQIDQVLAIWLRKIRNRIYEPQYLVDEPYQQINQARIEPGQEVSITIPESDSSRRKMSITDGLNKLSKNVRQF